MSKVSFMLGSNLVFQISKSNYMSANQIVDFLMEQGCFTLKKDNVMKSLDNMLYYGREITAGEYDCLTGKVTLTISDEVWENPYGC